MIMFKFFSLSLVLSASVFITNACIAQQVKFSDGFAYNALISSAADNEAELSSSQRCSLRLMTIREEESNSSKPFTGRWRGESDRDGVLTVSLVQHDENVTGTYCYMKDADQIDCPGDDNPHILHGRVSGNTVMLSFPSSSGEPDRRKVKVTLKGANLSWQLVEDPDGNLMPTPVSFDTLVPLP